MAKFAQGDCVVIQVSGQARQARVTGLMGGQGVDGECAYTVQYLEPRYVSRTEREVWPPAPITVNALERKLVVTIRASDAATVEDMIESLARTACDIANSTTDDEAHIVVEDELPEPTESKLRA